LFLLRKTWLINTFRCLNKWYMRFVVINQNEKDYN